MKGRVTILRYGCQFQTITDFDKTPLTCRDLHNILLSIDSLYKNLEIYLCLDWEIFDNNGRKKMIWKSKLNLPLDG